MLKFRHSRAKGDQGERLALNYLHGQGLVLVEKNVNSPYGEVDIIMRDGKEWVFVEVRFRRSKAYGGGLESVDRTKQQKLIRTASHYIQQHNKTHFDACRFDIIDISGDLQNAEINWIKDAFQLD